MPVLSALSSNTAYYANGNTSMPGWTVDMLPGAGPYIQLTNNSAFPGLNGTDGVQWLDLTGIVGRGGGVLSNAVATSASLDYILSFDVGAVFYTGSFGAATVDLLVDGVAAGSYTVQPPSSNGFRWTRFTHSFAGDGTPVRIGLYASLSTSSSNLGVGLDNVVLESIARPSPGAVPEPATWALLVAGFGLMGVSLRRRGLRDQCGIAG